MYVLLGQETEDDLTLVSAQFRSVLHQLVDLYIKNKETQTSEDF